MSDNESPGSDDPGSDDPGTGDPGTGDPGDPVEEALQEALAGEHAAIYAYTVIGGRLDDDSALVRQAVESHADHRALRDVLTEVLLARGDSPVPTEAGYALPTAVDGAASARRLARLVEDRCGVLHAALVATAEAEERRLGAQALVDCALRGLRWGARPTAFPGVGAA
jgi:hypothetical protein